VPPERGQDHVAILPTGPADDLESCSLMYLHLISRAQRRLWVASPYFVPDQATFAALQLAALRGVDVRVIMPRKPDNVLVRMSALTFIPEAMAAGIRAYSHTVGFMHQKVMLSDDLACVGTANLDNRSLRINFEISALAHGGTLAKQVEAMFHSDFEGCHGIGARDWSGRSWLFRAACRAARLMAPIQ
jgi:cardiolipin synthase